MVQGRHGILTGYYITWDTLWFGLYQRVTHVISRTSVRSERVSDMKLYDMCHELIKSILKYNLFITYHIQRIVMMYQCVTNAILSHLMITYKSPDWSFWRVLYDTVNGLFWAMHVRPGILFMLRLRCFLSILWWIYIGNLCERYYGPRARTCLFMFLSPKGSLVVSIGKNVWEIQICKSYKSNGSRCPKKWHWRGVPPSYEILISRNAIFKIARLRTSIPSPISD